MAQADYWRGGWAMPNMDELPGRKAAASARSSYGPLNALADIIGAVMIRNDQRGTMKEIEGFGNEIDTAVANASGYPEPTADATMGKGVDDLTTLQNAQPQPKKLSYSEYANKVKNLRSQLANRVLRKYGANNMNMALAAVDDTVNQRIGDYGRQLMDEAYNKIFDGVDVRTQGGQWEAAKRYMDYQNLARQTGQEGMSPQEFKDLLNTQAMKLTQIQQGNKVGIYASPASGAAMDDGSYIRPVGNAAIGMSPEAQARLNFQQSEAQRDQYNKDRQFAFNESIQNYKMKLDEMKMAMDKGAETQGWGKNQIDQANMILDAHKKWIEANPGEPPTSDPNYGMVDQIYKTISGNLGLKQKANTNSGQPHAYDSRVAAWVKENMDNGATPEEIAEGLRKNGHDPSNYGL